jgi:hypothetical protein
VTAAEKSTMRVASARATVRPNVARAVGIRLTFERVDVVTASGHPHYRLAGTRDVCWHRPQGTIETNRPGSEKCGVETVRIPGESVRSTHSGDQPQCDDAYSLAAGQMASDRTDLVPGRRSRS